ncbi:MAG: hypothetical protein NC230_06310 [Bacteroides sp.]|nr:hypothetical protein [Bacteroides sp.]
MKQQDEQRYGSCAFFSFRPYWGSEGKTFLVMGKTKNKKAKRKMDTWFKRIPIFGQEGSKRPALDNTSDLGTSDRVNQFKGSESIFLPSSKA